MKTAIVLMYKPLYFLLLLLFFSSFSVQAQSNNSNSREPRFWDQVRFGGSVGLSFGNGFFTGALAPSAIYDFNSYFSAGVGLSGAYASRRNYKTTSLGGSVIGLLRPIRQLQLSAEYEQLNINRKYEMLETSKVEHYWVPALFLGIGYNMGNVVAGVRYDVLHDSDKSFYRNGLMPFVSVYF